MSEIKDLLKPESIRLDAPATSWEDAIRMSGKLLENKGSISSAYTESMIDSVHKNGPYIVVAPGFAFAHARPSNAVHETQMSLVRLAQPVRFGHPSNDPVDLVIALAAKDSKTHTKAMAELAKVVGNKKKRAAIDRAQSAEEALEVFNGAGAAAGAATGASSASKASTAGQNTRNKILTVCGNGLGTSLFLKNTLDQVLDEWGWGPYIATEATDTISAKGKAKEADCILTSGEIARALGDVGVPVYVVENFTSTPEIDAALRELYDV